MYRLLQVRKKFCVDHYTHLFILDEIYEHLVFPGNEYHAFSSLSHDVPVLSCGGEQNLFYNENFQPQLIFLRNYQEIFSARMEVK